MKLSTLTLSCFTEVCREKGFSPAATKLDKSQSAVSTQIGLAELKASKHQKPAKVATTVECENGSRCLSMKAFTV